NTVEHGIDGHLRRSLNAGQDLLLLERNAELLIRAQQLRIDLVEALRTLHALRRRVVMDVLEVDLGVADLGPCRLRHGAPAAVGFEPPLEHPLRFALLARDEAADVLVDALRGHHHRQLRLETVLVLVDVDLPDLLARLLDCHYLLRTNPFLDTDYLRPQLVPGRRARQCCPTPPGTRPRRPRSSSTRGSPGWPTAPHLPASPSP